VDAAVKQKQEATTDVQQSAKEPSFSTSLSKFGDIQLTIRYSSQRNVLIVVVHECRNLIPCDKDNLADPYVRLYLHPDRSSTSKKRTKLAKNNLNPVFDETFEWSLGAMEIPFRSLDIAVKNDVGVFSTRRTTDMGNVLLKLSELGDIGNAKTLRVSLNDPKAKQ
jgi:hypothetical protein